MIENLPKTETPYSNTSFIDQLKDVDALKLMLKEQKKGLALLDNKLEEIEIIVNKVYNHLLEGMDGRIVYIGAGTSGRIGVQDGVELYPTFGWPNERLEYVIAGGKEALTKSIENSEDDILNAKNIIKKLAINKSDVIFALAASGNTPFTLEALKTAKNKLALTIAISNNDNGKILNYADLGLILDTGPEVITGSTRLKAGTVQKVCLNMISTLLMIKFGNIINGNMINMVANNKKLVERKNRILKRNK